jgi:hypothetical protein
VAGLSCWLQTAMCMLLVPRTALEGCAYRQWAHTTTLCQAVLSSITWHTYWNTETGAAQPTVSALHNAAVITLPAAGQKFHPRLVPA